jgi:urease accessory protein
LIQQFAQENLPTMFTNSSILPRTILTLTILIGVSSLALAHPHHQHDAANWTDGFLHPIFGLDHLLAMVATGLLAAQLGGAALWAVPTSFVGSMIVGGICGMFGMPLPGVEVGIALSVVLLGLAVTINRQQPLLLSILAVAVFGFFHGHAHGTEVPELLSPAVYVLGFVVSTIALQLAGVVVGRWLIASVPGKLALRVSGAAIACMGLMFLFGE